MVKIKHWTVGDTFGWVNFYPVGIDEDPPVPHWHLVNEHFGDIYDYMGLSTFSYGPFLPDLETARLCALDLAAHPQVITDMCPYCHDSGFQFFGPLHYPRWNIYRGPRGEPLVPAYHWSEFNPDPPAGQQWYWPFPFPPP